MSLAKLRGLKAPPLRRAYRHLRISAHTRVYLPVNWPPAVLPGQCILAYTRVYWPTTLYTGLHPCIQANNRVYQRTPLYTVVLAYVRVYLPKSTFASVHPCKLVGVWS
jgi:hypothetical protein